MRSLERERRWRGAVGMSAGKGGISLILLFMLFVLFMVWFVFGIDVVVIEGVRVELYIN